LSKQLRLKSHWFRVLKARVYIWKRKPSDKLKGNPAGGKSNILVVVTRHKKRGLRSLRVDTGDAELDEAFRGYISVKTGYR